jgi:hypothetical protein
VNLSALDNQFPHRISLSQAAELSGYHQDYLGQLCRLGKIKAAKIGRNWYTTQSELQTLINFTDTIEDEGESFNTQVDTEDEKGLFDFSEAVETSEEPQKPAAMDSARPSAPQQQVEEVIAVVERAEDDLAARAVVPTPVIADNYIISEVSGIPIRLQADNPARQHHTLQTLITKMKLETLRAEVLQLSDFMQGVSAELDSIKQVVARHDQVLKHRKDLATTYAASIDMVPEQAVAEQALLTLEDNSVPEQTTTKIYWVAPAFAIAIVVVATGLMVFNNLPSSPSQLSTIQYPVRAAAAPGFVAGDNTNSAPSLEDANIILDQ